MNTLFFALLAALASSAAADRTLIFMHRNMSYGADQEVYFVASGRYGEAIPIRTIHGTNETLELGNAHLAMRTNNNPDDAGIAYHPDNNFGEDYWLLEMDMDCTATSEDWFQLQAFVGLDGMIQELENIVDQRYKPVDFMNNVHYGRCGYINVYEYGMSGYDWYHIDGNAYTTNIFIQKSGLEEGHSLQIVGGRAACHKSKGAECDVEVTRVQMLDYGVYSQFDDFSTYISALSWEKVDAYAWSTGVQAKIGVPLARTSNNPDSPYYADYVEDLGDDFWFVQMEMVCSDTNQDDMFAFRTQIVDANGKFVEKEGAINQELIPEYLQRVHYGRCDDSNIYVYNEDAYTSVWTMYYFKDLHENGPQLTSPGNPEAGMTTGPKA